MSRIGRLFTRLAGEGRPALIAYLTAGDPSPDQTPMLVAALERGGADLIELGVPFSDPIADGPVIQRAADRALKQGTSMTSVLEIARRIRTGSEIPLLLFTYMNPAMRYGFERLARDAREAGIDGCLLTDLSVEEAGDFIQSMKASGLDTVFLAAPTSTDRRLELVAKYSSGFIYLVSRTGVTGEQSSVAESGHTLVERMRRVTPLPLALGFGISRPEHAAQVGQIADGVVVGSAIVRLIERYGDDSALAKNLEAFTRELSGALPRRTT
ncbi:MAG TPA: tryptophan synthase subunit alpha [Bryobacteraceae bacterium]|nr:tryptophan synthase subunit alpha [Bryobacteraceae bacterium]